MACIGKILVNLDAPCGAPAKADLGRPVSAKVLNAADIASFTVSSDSGVATITRKPKTYGCNLTAVNNSLTVSVGLKSQDIIPGAYEVSITFKTFSGAYTLIGSSPIGVAGTLTRAELVFAVDHGDVVRVYGLGAPLVCTEISGDSSESAYVTYTYGVEDWQVGTTVHLLDKGAYDALSTPQPEPKEAPKD